jgi:hypothetical protein
MLNIREQFGCALDLNIGTWHYSLEISLIPKNVDFERLHFERSRVIGAKPWGLHVAPNILITISREIRYFSNFQVLIAAKTRISVTEKTMDSVRMYRAHWATSIKSRN